MANMVPGALRLALIYLPIQASCEMDNDIWIYIVSGPHLPTLAVCIGRYCHSRPLVSLHYLGTLSI